MTKQTDQYDEIRRLLGPDKVGYILMLEPRRIGVLAFATFLEYRHFPPLPRNDDFMMALLKWEEMKWAIICIPRSQEHLVPPILAELGLRIADGVPTCISSAGTTFFPIQQPNVFTIENVAGHFVYKNDPASGKSALDFEDEAVEREQTQMMERWKAMNVGAH